MHSSAGRAEKTLPVRVSITINLKVGEKTESLVPCVCNARLKDCLYVCMVRSTGIQPECFTNGLGVVD